MKRCITLLIVNLIGKTIMTKAAAITEEKAFEQDVKTMSYEELMASIRYLDHERDIIAKRVHPKSVHNDSKLENNKKVA